MLGTDDEALSKLFKTVCFEEPTVGDVNMALQYCDKKWIIPAETRAELYSKLFNSTSTESDIVCNEVVEGKIGIIRVFQSFALNAAKEFKTQNGNNELKIPKLKYFIEDAFSLLEIFQSPIEEKSPSESYRMSDGLVKVSHPHRKFREERKKSWDERWRLAGNHEDSTELDDYTCGLTDALFGLTPYCQKKFHYGTPYCGEECLEFALRTVPLYEREPSAVPRIELFRLENKYIVSRGPFRFLNTSSLNEHLDINENDEILIYTDWTRWAGFKDHKILEDKPPLRAFDIMTSEWREFNIVTSCRVFLSRIYKDLQITNFLIFPQPARPYFQIAFPPILTRIARTRTGLAILRLRPIYRLTH